MIVLKPITHKAKCRLKELKQDCPEWNGAWGIVDHRDAVLFTREPGPWLLIVPTNIAPELLEIKSRWVHEKNDKDFIVELEEAQQAVREINEQRKTINKFCIKISAEKEAFLNMTFWGRLKFLFTRRAS